ncbi:MAG: GYF domain-containing protein [Opitutales bacterium]
MERIHIARPGEGPIEYALEDARAIREQGSIPEEALYWQQGMAQWQPAAAFFEGVAAIGDSASGTSLSPPIE